MVVQDETFLGAIDTFAAEQGVGMEAAEDHGKDFVHEHSSCWGRGLHFVSVHAVR